MAYLGLKHTMARISVATPESPIAVFTAAEPGYVLSVFAATWTTSKLLAQKPDDLIGIYDATMDQTKIRLEILTHTLR